MPEPRDDDIRLRLRPSNLNWREIDDEIVVLDLDGSEYISVRGAGRILWDLLATGSTLARLAAELVDRYDVDTETAARDAEAFVGELRTRNLIVDG